MKEETTTQWPQLELLHYKFSLRASRVHVVLILQHFIVARGEKEQQI